MPLDDVHSSCPCSRPEVATRIRSADLLSRPNAAERIGLSPATLAKLAVVGGGPRYLKLGRRVVYRASDLDAWVAARSVANTAEAQARGLVSLTPAAA